MAFADRDFHPEKEKEEKLSSGKVKDRIKVLKGGRHDLAYYFIKELEKKFFDAGFKFFLTKVGVVFYNADIKKGKNRKGTYKGTYFDYTIDAKIIQANKNELLGIEDEYIPMSVM